jgi:hypothetical protein
MTKRKRNYRAEYQRRVQRGKTKGLSLSQSRGHPKIREDFIQPKRKRIPDRQKIQIALSELAGGKTLKESAHSVGLTVERFKNFISREGIAERQGNRWKIRDEHPREMALYSNGKAYAIIVNNIHDDASLLGRYLSAVRQALNNNDPSFLKPFKGKSVKDIHGKAYPFETRLDALYERNRADPFENVYRHVF